MAALFQYDENAETYGRNLLAEFFEYPLRNMVYLIKFLYCLKTTVINKKNRFGPRLFEAACRIGRLPPNHIDRRHSPSKRFSGGRLEPHIDW